MNRTQTACYALIASAFILAGLLIFQLGTQHQNEANAGMVIAEGSFSIMTARTRTDEESLFVLENNSGILLVYRLELSKREITPVGFLNVAREFAR